MACSKLDTAIGDRTEEIVTVSLSLFSTLECVKLSPPEISNFSQIMKNDNKHTTLTKWVSSTAPSPKSTSFHISGGTTSSNFAANNNAAVPICRFQIVYWKISLTWKLFYWY